MIREVTLRERLLASTSDMLRLQQRMVTAIAASDGKEIDKILTEMKDKVWSMEMLIDRNLHR